MTDVLLVSLGGTLGLREADAELAASMRRAGADVHVAGARRVREWRTMAAIDLAWALSARAAAIEGIARSSPRAVLYSTTTAALLGPRPGAVRFDAPAAGNRPGRHGVWQRPAERRTFREARLLAPWSTGSLAEAPESSARAVVVPVPVAPSGPPGTRDIAAVTYAANPAKKGLDRVLAAWRAVRRPGEELVVGGLDGPDGEGVRHVGRLARPQWRALVRRARVFVTAPRREDYGISQLEALADGCVLVTTPSPGPYAALPIARELDDRTVDPDLGAALRAALDDPLPGYHDDARRLLAPFSPEAVDRVVADELLPALLTGR